MSSEKKVVIAGAGMTGMMCALKLTEKIPGSRIVIFDKAPLTGGMYNSVVQGDGKIFDHGMHVIYESCNPEVDELYFKVMPASEWNILEKNRKDIAGAYFRGNLQNYSHYVDLRSFPEVEKTEFIGSLFLNLGKSANNAPSTALGFLRSHFGDCIAEKVHKPLLKSLYSIDPEKLDTFAVKTTALERVVLFDSTTMSDLMKAEAIRSRIAYPDQLNLPPYRTNNQRALYPKKFGMANFIQELQKKLVSCGVRILTNTSLLELVTDGTEIKEVYLSGSDGGRQNISVEKMLWTGGWPALAAAFKVNMADLPFQRGIKIVYVNITLDEPPLMDDLYYFYCYDTGYASFRVTSYSNYCPDAAKDGAYPLCVELWPSRLGLAAETLSDDECEQMAIAELRKMGVINDTHTVTGIKAGSRGSEFPLPTVENKTSLAEVKARVNQINLSNIIVAGIMAEDGLFFIPDILNDATAKIQTADFGKA
jgi:protoporphyrinogen oxidase